MSDLRDLYQELILDHTKHPRNFGALENANCRADGHNPLCGDKLTVFLDVSNGVVKDARFQGSGCAISTASASMMTESIKGKTRAEAETLFERFHQMLTSPPDVEVQDAEELGKLVVFSGVKEFPVRVKCATLAWHTMNAAMRHEAEPVSTE
ncbi:MAG: SUF system NifU family Fe-S cluster assembly protein [Acidimicrobiia bacterium]|nr:SUF system NifU family Fe-S cluster assembly protein [Acidimicrobiia bacterium]